MITISINWNPYNRKDICNRKNFARPQIVKDLELKKHGLEWFVREPHAFTPLKDDSRYLLLGSEYVACTVCTVTCTVFS